MFHALPGHIKKHLFFHNGAHVYMNNWQSIDFRESMNALLSQKLLGYDNDYQLPTVIWQDNSAAQTWTDLETFGGQTESQFPLGQDQAQIQNHYDEETFEKYCKSYPTFHQDLIGDQANQVTLDFELDQDIHLNGRAILQLQVKSSVSKGLLSAQLLDFGTAKRLSPIPGMVSRNSLDNGRYYAQENLTELPFTETPYRLITKGFINLQNRTDLLTVEAVTPNQWMTLRWKLQPTIYKLKKGDKLRLVLYTTDFECTVRDNSEWQISLDLSQSQLILPH
jgi:X-Pro dipeptidyl-peptidase